MARIYTPDMTDKELEMLQSIFEKQKRDDIAIGVNALREAAYNDTRNFPNGGEPRFDKNMHYNSTIFGCIDKGIAYYIDENGAPSEAHAKEIKHAQNLKTCIRFVMDTTDLSNEQVLALFSGDIVGNARPSSDMTTRLAMMSLILKTWFAHLPMWCHMPLVNLFLRKVIKECRKYLIHQKGKL